MKWDTSDINASEYQGWMTTELRVKPWSGTCLRYYVCCLSRHTAPCDSRSPLGHGRLIWERTVTPPLEPYDRRPHLLLSLRTRQLGALKKRTQTERLSNLELQVGNSGIISGLWFAVLMSVVKSTSLMGMKFENVKGLLTFSHIICWVIMQYVFCHYI